MIAATPKLLNPKPKESSRTVVEAVKRGFQPFIPPDLVRARVQVRVEEVIMWGPELFSVLLLDMGLLSIIALG